MRSECVRLTLQGFDASKIIILSTLLLLCVIYKNAISVKICLVVNFCTSISDCFSVPCCRRGARGQQAVGDELQAVAAAAAGSAIVLSQVVGANPQGPDDSTGTADQVQDAAEEILRFKFSTGRTFTSEDYQTINLKKMLRGTVQLPINIIRWVLLLNGCMYEIRYKS